MEVNPSNIPKKKFDKLLGLADKLRDKRLIEKSTKHKSNHAAFILTKNFDVISYGENHCRNVPNSMSVHAERQALKNIKLDRLKHNKSYYMFVTKLSPRKGLLGESMCCARCNLMLRQSDVKISRVYYSVENGIDYCNINDLPIHITERDRRLCSPCKTLDKLSNLK